MTLTDYRIRRQDRRNIVIERRRDPAPGGRTAADSWAVVGYYSDVRGLVAALISLSATPPVDEAADLARQVEALARQVDARLARLAETIAAATWFESESGSDP